MKWPKRMMKKLHKKFFNGAEPYDFNARVQEKLNEDPDFELRSRMKINEDCSLLSHRVVGAEGFDKKDEA